MDFRDTRLICVYIKNSRLQCAFTEEVSGAGKWFYFSGHVVSGLTGFALITFPPAAIIVNPIVGGAIGAYGGIHHDENQEKKKEQELARGNECRGLMNLFKAENCVFNNVWGINTEVKSELKRKGTTFFDKDCDGLKNALIDLLKTAGTNAVAQGAAHGAFALVAAII